MHRQQRRVLRLREHVLNKESGEDVRLRKAEMKRTELVEEEAKQEDFPAYEDVVKADIRKMLDDKDIEYNERDNKSELYELLVGSD